IKSSPEFSDYFQDGATYWDAPKTWHVNHSKMSVKGQELGLVRNKVYDDFKVAFDISFNNQKGAVWIVRARDKTKYYLLQRSGPEAAYPMAFRSVIWQNGQLKSVKSDRVVEELRRPNDSNHIIIEAKGDTIKHFIQLKSDPVAGSQLLGILTDNT